MRRKLGGCAFGLGLAGILAVGLSGGWMLLYNNWSVAPVSRAAFVSNLNHAITRSREWVVNGGESRPRSSRKKQWLLGNPALLHMVADCARLSGDEQLLSVVMEYFPVGERPYAFGRFLDSGSRFQPPRSRHRFRKIFTVFTPVVPRCSPVRVRASAIRLW